MTDARSNGAVTMAQASVIAPYERHAWGDSTGGFLLDSLPAGSVTVRIRRLGYEPVVRTLTLQPNRSDTLRIALQPGSECPRR
ncbi:MAG: carboxypeptidase regulatory-like domain-containing protein [Gemmatimonadaceae bacterium]|nr:carboxypeptidase regulatory-like domain-containing protein [Gemmatimonadaceae bacterium]MCW5827585.1 carboxypeptidase regulatory-like domain-containing protein [Gemmatimonadaceae bacterium]